MDDAPAARAVLRMLRLLAERGGGVRAAALAQDLALPRSTVYKLLGVLRSEGFVMHLPEERSYTLSLRAMSLVADDHNDDRLVRAAQPLLRRLVHDLDVPAVAHLSVLRGGDVVYRAKLATPRAPSLVTELGVHLPANLTATGRAMLALLPAEQVRALYPNRDSLVDRTGRGPRTLAELRAQLQRAVRQGWAEEDGDVVSGLGSVAAAVTDHAGRPVAAVGLTYRSEAVDGERWPELGRQVRAVAAALGMRVRGRI